VFITVNHNFQLTGSFQEKPASVSHTGEKAALCISISLGTKADSDNKGKATEL
jgi:hypothetical protein